MNTNPERSTKGAPKALDCGDFPPLSQPDRATNNPSAPSAIGLFPVSYTNAGHSKMPSMDAKESRKAGKSDG